MRKVNILILALISLFVISACSEEKAEENMEDELPMLEVEFEPTESATIDETVELVTTVTYDEELVTDADQMDFEYWFEDEEDNSTTVEATNNKDGTYSAEVTFDQEGEYWIYAHTTAHELHTMPKRSIQVSK